MLGRAAAQTGMIIPVRAVSTSTTKAVGIVIPQDKSIFKPTPTSAEISQELKDKWYPQLGNRDIVGRGFSFNHDYFDAPDIPMPGVRWAANTPEVLALREKEMSCWKSLTLDEKKQLYRNSYQKNFSEMHAPTGNWKRMFAHVFYLFGFALLYQIYVIKSVYKPKPEYNEESMKLGLVTNLIIGNEPMDGSSSKYDYEKNQWK